MIPFREKFWKQFGGGPDEELRKRMDPEFCSVLPRIAGPCFL